MKLLQILVFILVVVIAAQQYFLLNIGAQRIVPSTDSDIGRYHFLQLSNLRRDQFMVDTKTGRVWTVVCKSLDAKNASSSVSPEDCLSENFQAIPYDNDYTFAPGPEQHEKDDKLRAEKISVMTPDEYKVFKSNEESNRDRTEKLELMTPEERKTFYEEEKKRNN